MPSGDYTIRVMSRPEVDLAIEWAAADGWNPGLHDTECFYAADPFGFLIGLVGGAPVATISAVQDGSSFGFLGLFLVGPQYRGRGYGVPLWQAGLAHLDGRVIGLNAVPAQQQKLCGLLLFAAVSNAHFSCPPTCYCVDGQNRQ